MKTIYDRFKEWFDKHALSRDMIKSLDKWQLYRIEDACLKAYIKGRNDKKIKS